MSKFRFGDRCMSVLLKWIDSDVAKDSHILDVGCGNGIFIKKLKELGYNRLFGIDYSQNSIQMANLLLSGSATLRQMDVINNPGGLDSKFDFIFDKGTFDAISLNPEVTPLVSSKIYMNFILNSLEDGGVFMLTSCNWTKDQLLSLFDGLGFLIELKHKTFTFGSKQGQDVTTVIFKK